MNYETFEQQLLEGVQRRLSDTDIHASMKTVRKTNETLNGIEFRKEGVDAAPIIYPKEAYAAYQAGRPMEDLIRAVTDAGIRHAEKGPELPELNRDFVAGHLTLVVMNEKENRDYLRNTLYEKMEDLAVVPRVRIDAETSFLMDRPTAESFHMKPEDALAIAHYNLDQESFTCVTLAQAIGIPEDPSEPQFYMLTNDNAIDGAVAIASDRAMDQARKIVGEDFLILPSSRHEVLLVPRSAPLALSELESMVRSINRDEVDPKDRLSDHVYRYRSSDRSIKMVEAQKKPPVKQLDSHIIY